VEPLVPVQEGRMRPLWGSSEETPSRSFGRLGFPPKETTPKLRFASARQPHFPFELDVRVGEQPVRNILVF
jgi:hypothetical protein